MSLVPKILVADDDETLNRTLSWVLKDNGYDVETIAGGKNLVERLLTNGYDLLLLDILMPDVDGLDLLERIKTHPDLKNLPVLMISSMPPEEGTITSLGLGAADFIPKPIRIRELLARVKAHLRASRELDQARAEARSRDDMMDILREVTATIKSDEIYQILVRRVARGLKISKCSIILAGPDDTTGTVVAAYENPMLRSLEVDLKHYPEVRETLDRQSMVLVADVTTDPLYHEIRTEWESKGVQVPTRSVVSIPFSLKDAPAGVFFLRTTDQDPPLNVSDGRFAQQVITAAVSALEKAHDLEKAIAGKNEMRRLAEVDPLTEAFNRRALLERMTVEMERTARFETVLACLMIDIDDFKDVNDTYGHLVGDRVLRQFADMLRQDQRAIDVVARYGGEEFVVLLPETGATGARIFAERILRDVTGRVFGDDATPVRLTVSIGGATYPDKEIADGASLLHRADQNLYMAKREGRNRYQD
ncbi:MAG: diguanylate cyclase [Gemmatimonadales bacterium]|nr:diguanylate cyclase [Gemmatimonadales bacterium]